VVLFAGTERLSQYAPRAGTATVLSRPVSCSPCRSFECPYELQCLDIPPEQVVGAVLARLGRPATGGQPKRGRKNDEWRGTAGRTGIAQALQERDERGRGDSEEAA
jgi:hypothetical protein